MYRDFFGLPILLNFILYSNLESRRYKTKRRPYTRSNEPIKFQQLAELCGYHIGQYGCVEHQRAVMQQDAVKRRTDASSWSPALHVSLRRAVHDNVRLW